MNAAQHPEVPPLPEDEPELPYAPVWARAVALVLDLFVVAIAARALGALVHLPADLLEPAAALLGAIYAAVGFSSRWRATLAMALLRVRLAALDGEGDPTPAQLALRVAVVAALQLVASWWAWMLVVELLGGALAIVTARTQTAWDLIASTTVVADWRPRVHR